MAYHVQHMNPGHCPTLSWGSIILVDALPPFCPLFLLLVPLSLPLHWQVCSQCDARFCCATLCDAKSTSRRATAFIHAPLLRQGLCLSLPPRLYKYLSLLSLWISRRSFSVMPSLSLCCCFCHFSVSLRTCVVSLSRWPFVSCSQWELVQPDEATVTIDPGITARVHSCVCIVWGKVDVFHCCICQQYGARYWLKEVRKVQQKKRRVKKEKKKGLVVLLPIKVSFLSFLFMGISGDEGSLGLGWKLIPGIRL